MKGWMIVGWTYDADLHCCHCAEDRFGQDMEEAKDLKDREGNEPHPVFAMDEHDAQGEFCGDCREEIWPAQEEETDNEDNC